MDGCTNYSVLSEADRAQGNTSPPDQKCHRDLVTGWYRFEGAAGDRMPDKCVLMERCGTRHPGWLKGKHPTVAEGVVTRKVCYSEMDACCRQKNIVKVKNCGGHYVYELQRTRCNNFRYCGNAGACKLYSFNKRQNVVFKNIEFSLKISFKTSKGFKKHVFLKQKKPKSSFKKQNNPHQTEKCRVVI